MKRIKYIILIAVSILAIIGILIGTFIYKTKAQAVSLDTSVSPDNKYELSLFSVGEPDFPFGSAHGRITLKKNGKKISQTEIDLALDGCQISKENWSVVWQKAYAQITLCADEQPNEHWKIFFDGRIERLPDSAVETNSEPLSQRQKPVALSMTSTENESGEVIFLVSENDFIENYNYIFNERNGNTNLKPFNEWVKFEEKTPFNNYDAICHHFSSDEKQWSKPTLSIFTSKNGEGICEFKLTFDDHGYQEDMYREFQEMCLCTLSAILPELSDDEIDVLYSKLYEQTDKNFLGDFFLNPNRGMPGIEVMYRSEDVGLYGYYGAGTANICIVPLGVNATDILNEQGIDSQSVK